MGSTPEDQERPCNDHRWTLEPLMAYGLLESVAMEILGPRLCTLNEEQLILVRKVSFSKKTRAILMYKMTTLDVASMFIDHWDMLCSIPAHLLTTNGIEIVMAFFESMYPILGPHHLTTTTYQPHPNGKVKELNKKIMVRLRQYVSDHQRDRDIYSSLRYMHIKL